MKRAHPLTLLNTTLAILLALATAAALLPLGLSEAGAGLVVSDDLVLRGDEEVRVVYRTPAMR